MDDTQEMLFTIQRFQVLSLYTSASAQSSVTDSYAFAWSESIYPFLNRTAIWHQPFEPCFAVGRSRLEELHQLLSDRWKQKQPITFFELEELNGIHGPLRPGTLWDEEDLILACRYFYLHEEFDEEFWNGLLGNGQCPADAEVIASKFDPDDVYFE